MLVVWCAATAAYWKAGWSFQDALYMVTLTVFTVGYAKCVRSTPPICMS